MKLVNTSSKVRKINIALDTAALFDVLLIAILMTLTTSKFILSTGMGIDVSSDILPVMKSPEAALADMDISVVTASGKSMLIFEGEIFSAPSFGRKVAASGGKYAGTTLLVKAEKNIDAQTLIDICQAAKLGGFKRVQIAAKPMPAESNQ